VEEPGRGWRSSRKEAGGADARAGASREQACWGGGASRDEGGGDGPARAGIGLGFTVGRPFYTEGGEKNERSGFALKNNLTDGKI
jgi:hypothetical protein